MNAYGHFTFDRNTCNGQNSCREIHQWSNGKTKITNGSCNGWEACYRTGRLYNVDLIIVDPPRKGLDQQVLQRLCSFKAAATTKATTLIYVSCGFDAFCNDYEQLTTVGKWKLQHAEGHILFPGSDAIETLAFFTK